MRISWSGGYKDVKLGDSSYRLRAVGSKTNVTLKFSLPDFVEFPLGAFINYEGQRYTLNRPQKINEINSTNFEYTLVFGGNEDLLENFKIKDTQGRLKFPLTATPREHLQVLINVLNTHSSGWSIGNCIDADEKLISYNHTNCFDALQTIANDFKTEWEVVGKSIHLKKVEYFKNSPLALSYGKGNGFISGVGRNNDDQKAGFNVLYVQGGERNIDRSKYGNKELLLPKNKEYTYEGITYVTDANGLSITQKGVVINSRKEESLDCSHIYPQRVGTVSEVVVIDAEKNFYDFKDSSIPADLDFSQCRMNGEKITIRFNSGMLSGREFEIQQEEDSMSGYIHSERRFKLVPKEEDGYTMPNETFKPAVGDKYAVFGMMMPNAYISDDATKTGASWNMFKEACKHFYENHQSKFTFKGTLDGIWAKKDWVNIGGKIKAGAFVSFSDPKFQPQGVKIRIVSVKDFINNPHSPIIELANSIQGGSIATELDKIKENEVVRKDLYDKSLDFTKRRFKDAQETIKMLEKAQLNFGKSINPITINTMGVLVGNQASQFVFVNLEATPTEVEHSFSYSKTAKKLTTAAGVIKYISNTDVLTSTNARTYKFWDVSAFESAVLSDADKSYYLYIKASKSNNTATFILSEDAIKLEEVTDYYHFLVGILNSEFEEQRSFVKLYGFSEYLPSQLKINRITGEGLDINLLTGRIVGNITFTNNSPAIQQIKDEVQTPRNYVLKSDVTSIVSKSFNFSLENDVNAIRNKTIVLSMNVDIRGGNSYDTITYIFGVEYNYGSSSQMFELKQRGNHTGRIYKEFTVQDKFITRITYKNVYVSTSNYGTASRKQFSRPALHIGAGEKEWSPAPEDIPLLIAEVETKATNANNKANTAQNTAVSANNKAVSAQNAATNAQNTANTAYSKAITAQNSIPTAKNDLAVKLGYASFNDMLAKAQQGKTIIDGGLINTQLINAVAVITKYLEAELLVANSIISSNAGFRVDVNASTDTPFRVYYPTGEVWKEIIYEDSKMKEVWYDRNGHVTSYVDELGFHLVDFASEQWKSLKLKSLGASKSGVDYSDFGIYQSSGEIRYSTSGTTYYQYLSARTSGTLTDATNNNRYYRSQNKNYSNRVADGYYSMISGGRPSQAMTDTNDNVIQTSADIVDSYARGSKWYMIPCVRIQDGFITENFNFLFKQV